MLSSVMVEATHAGKVSRTLLLASLLVTLFAAGCAVVRAPLSFLIGPWKITRAETRIPARGELPGLVGRVQTVRIASGETLLDVARGAGLGYQQVQDANRGADAWVPKPQTEVVLPSRWVLPRSRRRGIVINLPEMRLYLYPESSKPGDAVEIRTWPIGIGTDETPSPIRSFSVRTKEENPTWVVPDSIYRTMEKPQRVFPPGPDNPLGQYRMRLSYDLYSIHGTDTPWAVGRKTTHGCIRLYPEDIDELYGAVQVGTTGEILYQPVKIGEDGGRIYVQVHPDVYGRIANLEQYAYREVRKAGVAARIDPARLRAAVAEKSGVPVDVTADPRPL